MFISYSVTDSNVSIWYVDDVNYPKQAHDLIKAFDLSCFMATGYEVATENDLNDIMRNVPYECIDYVIDEDLDDDTWLHFHTILSNDENDPIPMIFLVCRSELEAYIYSRYDDYEASQVAQDTNVTEELMHYWYSQR